jgi:hypothetical protein
MILGRGKFHPSELTLLAKTIPNVKSGHQVFMGIRGQIPVDLTRLHHDG